MRIATWNVNSLKARMERVEEWLAGPPGGLTGGRIRPRHLRKARHCPYTSRPMNTSTRSRRESSRQASSLRRSMMSMPRAAPKCGGRGLRLAP